MAALNTHVDTLFGPNRGISGHNRAVNSSFQFIASGIHGTLGLIMASEICLMANLNFIFHIFPVATLITPKAVHKYYTCIGIARKCSGRRWRQLLSC